MEKLTTVFREVFDDPDLTLAPEMTANDVAGWDSLSHVNLILAVEMRFGIKFGQRELLKFRNIGDLLGSVNAKISG
jgi:acyl carrier protein